MVLTDCLYERGCSTSSEPRRHRLRELIDKSNLPKNLEVSHLLEAVSLNLLQGGSGARLKFDPDRNDLTQAPMSNAEHCNREHFRMLAECVFDLTGRQL